MFIQYSSCHVLSSRYVGYVGAWRDGKRNGMGVSKAPNNTRYEGNFANDLENGQGTIYYCGISWTGEWSNGHRVEPPQPHPHPHQPIHEEPAEPPAALTPVRAHDVIEDESKELTSDDDDDDDSANPPRDPASLTAAPPPAGTAAPRRISLVRPKLELTASPNRSLASSAISRVLATLSPDLGIPLPDSIVRASTAPTRSFARPRYARVATASGKIPSWK